MVVLSMLMLGFATSLSQISVGSFFNEKGGFFPFQEEVGVGARELVRMARVGTLATIQVLPGGADGTGGW